MTNDDHDNNGACHKPTGTNSEPEGADPEGSKPDDGYSVGYGKPPRDTRFKPGQSGNPRGKPKGQKSPKDIVKATLHEKITVQTPTGSKRMTKIEALIQTITNKALKGDAKASELVFKLTDKFCLHDEVSEAMSKARMNALDAEDDAILERILRQAYKTEVDS